MRLRRFLNTLIWVIFLAAALVAGLFVWQIRQEYEALKEREQGLAVRLTEAERQLRDQEQILERLRTDPAYVERVIRQRLGYAKPEEYIVRIRE